MDIGTSIAVFLILAVVLVSLFCVITKCYYLRLRKALEANDEVYSAVEDLNCLSGPSSAADAPDKDLVAKVEQQLAAKSQDLVEPLIPLTAIAKPLDLNENYGMSLLRRRLNGEIAAQHSETARSASSLNSFRPEKLNSHRSKGSSTMRASHSFVSKLVAYQESGLTLVSHLLKEVVCEGEGKYSEKKDVAVVVIQPGDAEFQSELELNGFEAEEFGAYKFEAAVDVTELKQGETMACSTQPPTSRKTRITLEEFRALARLPEPAAP